MPLAKRLSAVLVALVVPISAGCGADSAEQPSGGGSQSTTRESSGATQANNGQSGGGALGGNAKVGTLARAAIESEPPDAAAWNAWRVELEPGRKLRHTHAFSTIYAEQGSHTLTVGSDTKTIEAEGGAIVIAGQAHTHEAGDQGSTFWDVLLAEPGTDLPNAPNAERVFETDQLEGIPEQAEVAFLDVVLPPGGQTTVHTHPGPETIYITDGPFQYENGIEGATTVDDGDVKSIPPNTAVQKRNPGDGRPRFLSWFIVDPAKEFAPTTNFESSGG